MRISPAGPAVRQKLPQILWFSIARVLFPMLAIKKIHWESVQMVGMTRENVPADLVAATCDQSELADGFGLRYWASAEYSRRQKNRARVESSNRTAPKSVKIVPDDCRARENN